MKVLHLLASSQYSGAENVVCQIIKLFEGDNDMAYCSPDGQIKEALAEKQIKFYAIEKLDIGSLKKVVNEYKPDIIHAHDIKATLIASCFANRCKIISHIHDNKPFMASINIKSLLINFRFKKINHIFWVSNSCYTNYKFKKNVANKSTVLYNVINTKSIVEKANKADIVDKVDICYVGRLMDKKNPLRLIEIAKLLKLEKPNFKMAIIGNGAMQEEVENLSNSYELQNNVKFYGFQSNPFGILKNSKCMLMTSIFEGTPMCALESMALGVPVVSTPTDGMKDIIKNGINGFIYEIDTEAVQYIKKLISDDCYTKGIKKTTLEYSNNYNDLQKYKTTLWSKY